ncbi:carbohydrate binding domain-containing protein [Hymenobacter sp. 5317J-9]|uniref:carbohydrate binding domain-containing protein n=1 Tax=Hymenobacter sp. 5317J-9 TaxID=2932250 RepID=UPI001FD6E7F4|nr:carbohydrate binding domain-containing protein [Hymenobacter sp. 5317J-9]UOQ98178.1 carbohydrate binding domain-containing protein [Hymenobacter sp. 5317J-9]
MKNLLLPLAAVATLCLAGCGGKTEKDPNTLVETDFETLAGWIPEPQSGTLTTEKAHSGRYAIKVDGNHDYSLTYKVPMGELHDTRVKKIKVSAWTFVSAADAQAALVAAVGNPADPNKPLLWDATDLNHSHTPGKWVEINKVLTVPATASPASTLGVYMWRTGGTKPVYLDDLKVTIAE